MCIKMCFMSISGMPIFRYFWPDPFSADPFPVFSPQLFRLDVDVLYFLLFHLSLVELSVSFCVHFL